MKLNRLVSIGFIALLVLSCGADSSGNLTGTLWMSRVYSMGDEYIAVMDFKDSKTVIAGDKEYEYDFKNGDVRVFLEPKAETLDYIKRHSEQDALYGSFPMMAKFKFENEEFVFRGNEYKKTTREELAKALEELEKTWAEENSKFK